MESLEEIKSLANYCLNCKNKPCLKACPLNNDIPTFIKFIKDQHFRKAYDVLIKTSVMPSICGRICPHSKQCEGSCIRGIKGSPVQIGKLEAFIGDIAINRKYHLNNPNKKYKQKVAIIGSGPSGITCAAYLASKGFNVTVFEKQKKLGGLLQYGIPKFRLKQSIVNQTIKNILDLGIKVNTNSCLGKNLSFNRLKKDYDAIYLSIGSNIPCSLNIEGKNLKGVFGANSLLEYNLHPSYINKKVAIIGGGNVAIDCARTINRLGAKNTYIVYRRNEKQMPAENKEIQSAKSEGIIFLYQTNIIRILGDNNNCVSKIECIKTKLVSSLNQDREIPINIKDTNYLMDIDCVVMAIGSRSDISLLNKLGLNTDSKGYIDVDNNYMTCCDKVFAGGDLIGTKSTVAWASRSGVDAAKKIETYLIKNKHTKSVFNQ